MNVIAAFEKQLTHFTPDLRTRECALVALGRRYAADFEAGHAPSGSGVQRVLAELRRLAKEDAKAAAAAKQPEMNELDRLRSRRKAAGLND